MWVRVGHENSVEVCDSVMRKILSMYPEEGLMHRPVFEDAFINGYIDYENLAKESRVIFIPWQMFFLSLKNLEKELKQIEDLRQYKFSAKFFTKRSAAGNITSKRIIDRLIRLQNFVVSNYDLSKNGFCGLLKNKTKEQGVKDILDFFDLDIKDFRSKSKEYAFEYLMNQVSSKNINISRGVLRGGVLPQIQGINSVYRNTSGFVIKDECIPFIFLPDEVNPDEVAGRRIYTLLYLIACIGLGDYNFFIESDFKASVLKAQGLDDLKHNIVSELLLPSEVTEKLKKTEITKVTIDSLASRYKMTPTAVVVTLRKRGVIRTKDEYGSLLPEPYKPQLRKIKMRHAKIATSVKKFCGERAFDFVNIGIAGKTLNSSQAQYLIFGRIRKKDYKEYCSQLDL